MENKKNKRYDQFFFHNPSKLFLEKIKTEYQKAIKSGSVAAISLDARLRYIPRTTNGINIILFFKLFFSLSGLNKLRKMYKDN